MKTELTYRTFDELLATVCTDIPHLNLEGAIEPQQLIRVVTKINYELGLRVNPGRVKLLNLVHGKTRLPADFAVANYALLCEADHEIPGVDCTDPGYEQGLYAGLLLAQSKVEGELRQDLAQAQLFFTQLSIVPGENNITHNLHDKDLLVQVRSASGDEVFTRVVFTSLDTLSLISDAASVVLACTVTIYAAGIRATTAPCKEAVQVLTTQEKVLIRYQQQSGRRRFYSQPRPLRFVKSKGVDSSCQNLFQFGQGQENDVWIQNGFIGSHHQQGSIVLSYQSVLEDEEGSLLTLDHPKVNDYYEYALKEKIYENLWLSGEDVFQKLDYIQQRKLRGVRVEALSFINTPDFADFRKVWELNRKAQIHKYYSLFQ